MKLSSYLIIGAAVAQILFTVGAVCFTGIFLRRDVDFITISNETVNKSVDRFSNVRCAVTNYPNPNLSIYGTDIIIVISETDTISAPTINFSVDLEKVVTLDVSNDTLNVELDFTKLNHDGNIIQIQAIFDNKVPIVISAPRGMLKSIDTNKYLSLSISDMIADSLKIYSTSRDIELHNCRIDQLGIQNMYSFSLTDNCIVNQFYGAHSSGLSEYFGIKCSEDSKLGTVCIDSRNLSTIDLSDANYSSVNIKNSDENIKVVLNSDVVIRKAE